MKPLMFLAVAAGLALPAVASANCYFVFSPKNDLVYRSIVSPVDLSKPISSGVRGRFNAAHLTMIPDEADCPDLGPVGEPAARGGATSGPFASPLFRNAESRSAYDPSGGITSGNSASSSRTSGYGAAPGRRGR